MAGITLAVAEAKLTTWLNANDRIAAGQSYRIGERILTRADLGEVRKEIEYWQSWVEKLSANRGRTRARLARPI